MNLSGWFGVRGVRGCQRWGSDAYSEGSAPETPRWRGASEVSEVISDLSRALTCARPPGRMIAFRITSDTSDTPAYRSGRRVEEAEKASEVGSDAPLTPPDAPRGCQK